MVSWEKEAPSIFFEKERIAVGGCSLLTTLKYKALRGVRIN